MMFGGSFGLVLTFSFSGCAKKNQLSPEKSTKPVPNQLSRFSWVMSPPCCVFVSWVASFICLTLVLFRWVLWCLLSVSGHQLACVQLCGSLWWFECFIGAGLGTVAKVKRKLDLALIQPLWSPCSVLQNILPPILWCLYVFIYNVDHDRRRDKDITHDMFYNTTPGCWCGQVSRWVWLWCSRPGQLHWLDRTN